MKIWRLHGDGRDLHLAVEADTPAEGKDKALSLFPRFFLRGIKTLELRRDPIAEERSSYVRAKRSAHLGASRDKR